MVLTGYTVVKQYPLLTLQLGRMEGFTNGFHLSADSCSKKIFYSNLRRYLEHIASDVAYALRSIQVLFYQASF